MDRQAYLRPSSAATWSKCAGYAALNAALGTTYQEDADNDIREDGIACHWLAAELWTARRVAPGALSPNGREITEEMLLAVSDYHDGLRPWCQYVEQTIPVSRFFPGVSDGTPDAWGHDPFAGTVDVADLKYGFNPVDVWNNLQLAIYLWTLVCLLREQGYHPTRLRAHIFQPRIPHRDSVWRTWETTPDELEVLVNWLRDRAMACYAPVPDCTVNPGCGNCPAAFACRTLQAAGGAGMDTAYDATPFELDAPQLGYELSKLMRAQSHIENRINGLSTQAESLLRRGQRIPGFELGRAGTRWRWRQGAEQLVQRLGELFDVPVMQEPKVMSVAKLRNAFPVDVQAMYAEKPAGELKLRTSDPDEAIRQFHKR